MNSTFDVRTSKTLLEKLRVFEDHRAWTQFMHLYLPMVEAWGRRFGLPSQDVEELTSRLLGKLVQAIPRFEYDPGKGSFRGWLKTVTHHEVVRLLEEYDGRLPGDRGTGDSAVQGQLMDCADKADELVAGLHDQSEALLRSVHDAMKEVQGQCQGDERKSWEAFQRVFVQDEGIEPVARALGLTYHAAAMRVQRIKKRVKDRTLKLAGERGLLDMGNHGIEQMSS
ncbi:MAG TPA: sigma-70 family RNA polymerase sigma factor [Gemmataceae bacterium]|jgi:RNA polymerase sigma-70 factor (ECF subfamily)